MPNNNYGFIDKKYRQPHCYRNYFGYYNALYLTEKDNELMVEAQPHFLRSERLGAPIESYQILIQRPEGRFVLRSNIKTQKKAMEVLEQLYLKY